jgi:hypothetical protein
MMNGTGKAHHQHACCYGIFLAIQVHMLVVSLSSQVCMNGGVVHAH